MNPATSVSGRPIPSRRSGTESSPRNARTSIREASANSTSASVASASTSIVSPPGSKSIRPSASEPTSSPTAVKNIAAVIGVPAIRPEIAANASRASATTASAQCTAEPYSTGSPHQCAAGGEADGERLDRIGTSAAFVLDVLELVSSA